MQSRQWSRSQFGGSPGQHNRLKERTPGRRQRWSKSLLGGGGNGGGGQLVDIDMSPVAEAMLLQMEQARQARQAESRIGDLLSAALQNGPQGMHGDSTPSIEELMEVLNGSTKDIGRQLISLPDGTRVVVLQDIHVPTESSKVLRAVNEFVKNFSPHIIVLIGDVAADVFALARRPSHQLSYPTGERCQFDEPAPAHTAGTDAFAAWREPLLDERLRGELESLIKEIAGEAIPSSTEKSRLVEKPRISSVAALTNKLDEDSFMRLDILYPLQ